MTATFTRATLTPVRSNGTPDSNEVIRVHFNPTSLQISINNETEPKKNAHQKKVQFITKSSAQLTLDLIFDTTDTGSDVRVATAKVAQLMKPGKDERQGQPATIVKFEWGAFVFQGLIKSYKEIIDFFSSGGIPLRATLNLTLDSLPTVFDSFIKSNVKPEPVVIQNLSPQGDRLHEVSQQAGNSDASRAIAADNGLETLRFASGPIALNPNIKLSPPITFASTDAGGSIGGLIGGSAGLSIGGAAGIAASAGAGLSIGGAAGLSAGVSASADAFSELHSQRSQSRLNVRLDPSRLLQSPATVSLSNREDATFQMGGQVQASAESGFYADVGTKATLRSRIQFS
jgi:Contractile injection system tube protein